MQCMGPGDYIIGANEAGKRANTLFNCISVTDDIKINEQNNPIAKGSLLPIKIEFEEIYLLLTESYGGFEHKFIGHLIGL